MDDELDGVGLVGRSGNEIGQAGVAAPTRFEGEAVPVSTDLLGGVRLA